MEETDCLKLSGKTESLIIRPYWSYYNQNTLTLLCLFQHEMWSLRWKLMSPVLMPQYYKSQSAMTLQHLQHMTALTQISKDFPLKKSRSTINNLWFCFRSIIVMQTYLVTKIDGCFQYSSINCREAKKKKKQVNKITQKKNIWIRMKTPKSQKRLYKCLV